MQSPEKITAACAGMAARLRGDHPDKDDEWIKRTILAKHGWTFSRKQSLWLKEGDVVDPASTLEQVVFYLVG